MMLGPVSVFVLRVCVLLVFIECLCMYVCLFVFLFV